MWDYDTIAMERAQFPETLELITGKFARHSKAFYEWRIDDRLKRIEEEPENMALLDDLAVAYDKVGDHDEAIAIMLRKEERQPGLYETAANLGTFYIHAGELEKGLGFIEKAIAINPSAHFGREIYQKHLVEYVLYVRQHANAGLPLRLLWPPIAVDEGRAWPSSTDKEGSEPALRVARGFFDWIPVPEVNHEAAVKGLLGMMRFGNYDSPVLLEALGDLLAYGPRFGDFTGLLASRAYLKASYEVDDEPSREKYRELATMALKLQTGGAGHSQLSLEEVEAVFKEELAEAEAWYAEVHADELAWIESGQNPEAMFAEKFYQTPLIESSPGPYKPSPTFLEWLGVLVAALGVLFLAYRFARRTLSRFRMRAVNCATTN